jgi:predicted permease
LPRSSFFQVGTNGGARIQQLETETADDCAPLLEIVAERDDVAGEAKRSVAEVVFVNHGARFIARFTPEEGARRRVRYSVFVFRFSLHRFMNDFRYALRSLLKKPAFTALAVGTLAVAIGVNTAVFSIVDAIMLRPLSYPQPDRVVALREFRETARGFRRTTVSPANLADYEATGVFEALAGYVGASRNVTGDGAPERLAGQQASWNFFRAIGVKPAIGRDFVAGEDHQGRHHVVILSHELWTSRYGGEQVLGKTMTLDGEPYEIVGVMPAGFRPPGQFGARDQIQFYVPAGFPPEALRSRGDHMIRVVGRLRSNVSLDQAGAAVARVAQGIARTYPESNKVQATLVPLQTEIVGDLQTPLRVLLGAVGFVLLIACANVANLLLMRGVGRQREIAIRAALGAGRGRIAREFLVYSGVLGLAGGVAGLFAAFWIQQALVALAPANTPRLESVALDGRVVAFTAVVAMATSLLAGLLPAWRISAFAPVDALRKAGAGPASADVLRWRSLFAAMEVAVALILLVGAGLLLRSFVLLNAVDLGFQTDKVLTMSVRLSEAHYANAEQRLAFFERLSGQVERLPGVASASFSNSFPLRGSWGGTLMVEGSNARPDVDLQAVSPSYFRTLGIPLTRGRSLNAFDRTGSMPVALVNEAFVRQLLPEGDPLGRRLRRNPSQPWITIVGVVTDVRRDGRTADIRPQVYFPAAQTALYPVRLADLAVRATGDPHQLLASIQREVWAIDRNQPIANVRTLDEILDASVAQRRFQMLLITGFAIVAVLLALVGLYGVVSYAVQQRTYEIGIRMALGAGVGGIVWLVGRQVAIPVLTGLAVGLAGAYGLSQSLESLLFEIEPTDPITFGAVAVLLLVTSAAAAIVPARRATRVDPVTALRSE